jgi:hypothetical protein
MGLLIGSNNLRIRLLIGLNKKNREKQWESWKITIFGFVISKENTCELLLFLFEITCPL